MVAGRTVGFPGNTATEKRDDRGAQKSLRAPLATLGSFPLVASGWPARVSPHHQPGSAQKERSPAPPASPLGEKKSGSPSGTHGRLGGLLGSDELRWGKKRSGHIRKP